MNLNKGISTPIAILLIIAVFAVVGVLVWQLTKEAPERRINPPERGEPGDYTTQSACEEVGYYWYDDACHEEKKAEGNSEDTESTPSKPITLTSPNGGEEWKVGNKYEVSWDGPEELSQNERIGLFLWKGDEELYQINNIKSSLPKSGTYEWTISDKISCGGTGCTYLKGGNNYKVEAAVISFDEIGKVVKNSSDFSDDYFAINVPDEKECTDSDGGEDYFEKGTTHGTMCAQGAMTKDWEDYCSDSNTLVEYYCVDSYSFEGPTAGPCEANVKSASHQCSEGCENGTCLGSE